MADRDRQKPVPAIAVASPLLLYRCRAFRECGGSMIPLHNLIIYIGIYAVVIALPGPNVIAIAARALAGGFRAAVPAAFGTALGDILLMSFSAFGLELVANTSSRLFLAVKIAGVLYLLWLGYKYWTSPVKPLDAPSKRASSGFFAQLAVTAGNPKGMAFFFALL